MLYSLLALWIVTHTPQLILVEISQIVPSRLQQAHWIVGFWFALDGGLWAVLFGSLQLTSGFPPILDFYLFRSWSLLKVKVVVENLFCVNIWLRQSPSNIYFGHHYTLAGLVADLYDGSSKGSVSAWKLELRHSIAPLRAILATTPLRITSSHHSTP
eukprot:Phypoly_transcript_14570.p1 GENE.Phypoly_transcript_14570~~Phypoly_transcript_14570.p1  ORF type:complete len:157 (-),score=17.17 Phypoly_transcript_14570:182-652(-)